MAFPFAHLTAYRQTIAFCLTAEEIRLRTRGKVSRNLLEQFSRASLSIALNLAEGNGRWHAADKKQFYWIARGSAYECVPILEILHRTKKIDDATYNQSYRRLEEIARTLSGMIRATAG